MRSRLPISRRASRMPRALTERGYRAAQAEVENAALLALVTISHAGTPEFRVVNNTEPVVSRGNTFYPWAFEFALPQATLDRTPEVEFTIDNVTQALIDLLRAAEEPPEFLLEIVVSDTPDVVEVAAAGLFLSSVTWDKQVISGKLQLDDVFGQSFPSHHASYDPRQFPGLFA